MARILRRLPVIVLITTMALSSCAGGDSNADVPVTVAGAEALGTGDAPDGNGLGDGANLAVAATPEQLAFFQQSTASVTEIESYRAEMWMDATFDMAGFEMAIGSDDPLAAMTVDGDRLAVTMDLGAMMQSTFDELADQFGEGGGGDLDEAMEPMLESLEDWTIEMVVDGSTLYQRQPFMAEFADSMGAPEPVPGSLESLLTSGDWIRIDAEALGIDADALAAQQGGGALDLQGLAELVTGDELPVDYIGTGEVRGAAVETYRITTTFGDLARLGGGVDPGQYAGPGLDMEELLDSPVEIIVAVDAEGRPVRSEFASEMSMDTPEGDLAITFRQVTEYYDFDDPGITVEVPTDAVDATQQFATMIPAAMLTA